MSRPRIRTIKPEAGLDEELWDLGQKTKLPVFQAFVLLWCHADRRGRFEWRPRALKAQILPYWDGDFSRVLDALTTGGFLVRYACGTREFGWIRTFERHQVINNREADSALPAPPNSTEESTPSRVDDACVTRASRDDPFPIHSLPFQDGGMGGEPSKPKRKRQLPDSWEPTPYHTEVAAKAKLDLAREAAQFRDYHLSRGSTMVDWDRAFSTWLRNAETNFGRGRVNGKRGYVPTPVQPNREGARWEPPVNPYREPATDDDIPF